MTGLRTCHKVSLLPCSETGVSQSRGSSNGQTIRKGGTQSHGSLWDRQVAERCVVHPRTRLTSPVDSQAVVEIRLFCCHFSGLLPDENTVDLLSGLTKGRFPCSRISDTTLANF